MKKVFLKFSQILRETQVSEACNIFLKKILTTVGRLPLILEIKVKYHESCI